MLTYMSTECFSFQVVKLFNTLVTVTTNLYEYLQNVGVLKLLLYNINCNLHCVPKNDHIFIF